MCCLSFLPREAARLGSLSAHLPAGLKFPRVVWAKTCEQDCLSLGRPLGEDLRQEKNHLGSFVLQSLPLSDLHVSGPLMQS